MRKKIIVDPVTRIEGHLKVEVEIENNRVVEAKCSADMFRGIEKSLKGYDYLTAIQITQRTCGCCPYAHAEAAALAIENALNIDLNKNGKLLRNLVIGAYKVKDYILHFYTLSLLDFMDIAAILKYNGNDVEVLKLKEWVVKEINSKAIFPSALFLQRYNAAYIKSRELNFTLIESYLESFQVMREIEEMVKIFGAKSPHMTAIEAGGITTLPTADKLLKYINIAQKSKVFVYEKYLKDVLAVAKKYKSYFKIGKGPNSFLTANTLPDLNGNYTFVAGFSKNFKFEAGVDANEIIEYHDYAYYKPDGGFAPLELEELQPLTLKEFKANDKKYSWAKAPRYKNTVVEVGPAAMVINTYLSGKNKKLNQMVDKINRELNITIRDYNSVMGRHLSRVIMACLMIDKLIDDAFNVDEGVLGFTQLEMPSSFKTGVGITDATRGTLVHMIQIGKDGYIDNYEMIVPTTWNISPKDNKDIPGALELMLLNTKIKDPKNPIEIARVIRSTDPCLACSVH
jgi:Ni,Fe-hydrogenase I large subunit